MLCREHRGGKTVPKIDWAIRKRAFQVVWAISGQWIGQLVGMATPVSECVKCREVAWEERANKVVEVPILKILAYTCTLPRPQSGGHAAFVEH